MQIRFVLQQRRYANRYSKWPHDFFSIVSIAMRRNWNDVLKETQKIGLKNEKFYF